MQIHGWRLKEVHNLFIINFQEAAFDKVTEFGPIAFLVHQLLLRFNILKYVLEGPLHYTAAVAPWFFWVTRDAIWVIALICRQFSFSIEYWTLNGVCLTSSSLAIGKYGTVIPTHATISNRFGNLIENRLLFDILVANVVKVEPFDVHAPVDLNDAIFRWNTQILAVASLFLVIKRSNSDTYLNIIFGIIKYVILIICRCWGFIVVFWTHIQQVFKIGVLCVVSAAGIWETSGVWTKEIAFLLRASQQVLPILHLFLNYVVIYVLECS